MMKLAFALIVFTACAGHHPIPTPTPPLELAPINSSGAMSKDLRTGDTTIQIGLATRNKQTSVVRIDGKRLTELFAIPASVPNVPVTAFDYMIDPQPTAEDDVPGRFQLVASGNAGTMIYTVTWVFTWNGHAFDIAQPQVVSRDGSVCEVCDAA